MRSNYTRARALTAIDDLCGKIVPDGSERASQKVAANRWRVDAVIVPDPQFTTTVKFAIARTTATAGMPPREVSGDD